MDLLEDAAEPGLLCRVLGDGVHYGGLHQLACPCCRSQWVGGKLVK
jgi:hypothetical protein